jgi:hypothetical protein
MDEEKWSDLIETLQVAHDEQIKRFTAFMRAFVRYGKNMNLAQKEEYDRIGHAIKELSETYRRTTQELESLAHESATSAQQQEYLLRLAAILERDAEMFARLTKDYQHLLIAVIAR